MLRPGPLTIRRYGQRQEAQTFEASLGYITRLCLKTKQNRKERRKEKGGGRGKRGGSKGGREGKK